MLSSVSRRAAPLVLAFVLLAALVGSVGAARPATATGADSSYFVSATNSARADHGLPALSVRSDLAAVAQRWAQHLADHQELAHNPSVTSQVCCWQALGENVGRGPTAADIQRAFMNSTEHRDNILAGDFTEIGVGTARGSDGRLYVDEVFRRPQRSAPAPAPSAPHHVARSSTRAPMPAPTGLQLLAARLRALHTQPGVDPVAGVTAWQRRMELLARRG